ncbi:MAG: hypothetical protein PHX87_06110 [Candidatus Peribacteraceae bacterium]|nr:hypothetical protein [Candidatus Peribacteraceae bacterium]MDD5742964.1 hypothetical protein [Candidatus Peribacteraceae bacterium]
MNDDTAPATKADIGELREEFTAQFKTFKDEILRHFDLAVETIRHDLVGANRDEILQMKDKSQDHERRIVRLERSAGLPA